MKILVLGGTYFVGRNMVEKLVSSHHEVTLLNRNTINIFPDLNVLKADRHNKKGISKLLKGNNSDVIIDISGYTQADVEIVLDCFDISKITQYIFCSSAAVYSQPPLHTPIREEDRKCFLRENGLYGYQKLMAEELLFRKREEQGLNFSIFRPTYIYGEYDYSPRIVYFFEKIVKGEPIFIVGDGKKMVQLGYVDDLTDAIIMMLGNIRL